MKAIFRTTQLLFLAALILASAGLTSCHDVDDERIPNFAVNINLGNPALWNTYGVAGFGLHRNFILTKDLRVPADFAYNQQSATGFGGILLIGGMDPFTSETNCPLAYDLACPVEMKADIRVKIEGDLYEAVCPICGSHYDVTMAGGAPLSGPAATKRYGLRRYQCLPTGNGGYLIVN